MACLTSESARCSLLPAWPSQAWSAGITSIVAGALLAATEDWSMHFYGIHWINFHVLFAPSLVLRLAAVVLAVQIHEPNSSRTRIVVRELVLATRLRLRQLTPQRPVRRLAIETEQRRKAA